MNILETRPLTAGAFEPFGQVIETAGVTPRPINDGNTLKFAELARIQARVGVPSRLHIYRSRPAMEPIVIRRLERHVHGSQVFFPLHDRPFPLVVAAAGTYPPQPLAFMTNGNQGVALSPGTWHHYQLSLDQDSEYIVIDYEGIDADCEEVTLDPAFTLRASLSRSGC